MEALIDNDDTPDQVREWAKTTNARAREHFLFPVGIHIVSPEGELLASASVNRAGLFGKGQAPRYLAILERGIAALDQ